MSHSSQTSSGRASLAGSGLRASHAAKTAGSTLSLACYAAVFLVPNLTFVIDVETTSRRARGSGQRPSGATLSVIGLSVLADCDASAPCSAPEYLCSRLGPSLTLVFAPVAELAEMPPHECAHARLFDLRSSLLLRTLTNMSFGRRPSVAALSECSLRLISDQAASFGCAIRGILASSDVVLRTPLPSTWNVAGPSLPVRARRIYSSWGVWVFPPRSYVPVFGCFGGGV